MPIPLTALPPLTPLTVQDCFGLIWPHWFTHTQTHTYAHKLGARSHLMSTQKHEQCIWFHLCVYEMHIMFMKHQPRCRPWSFESAFNVEEAVLSSFHDCLHTHSLVVCGHVATALLRATLRSFWRWHETDKGGQMRWVLRFCSFSWNVSTYHSICPPIVVLSAPLVTLPQWLWTDTSTQRMDSVTAGSLWRNVHISCSNRSL